METDLTKQIKQAVRKNNPLIKSTLRTVRYAEEVKTATGIVDVIRFEDVYKEKEIYECKEDICKEENLKFPCDLCKGCVYKVLKKNLSTDICVTCIEIKITKSDFNSHNKWSFVGNRNFFAVPKGLENQILDQVPEEVGVLVYYPKSKKVRVFKKCVYKEISNETLIQLLYNALRKYC